MDFFDAFCGGDAHEKGEVVLAHILPGSTHGKIELRVENIYSYREARIK